MSSEPFENLRERILAALQRRGHDMANVSRDMGRNHAYLHQYLYQRKPRTLPEAERRMLQAATGIEIVDGEIEARVHRFRMKYCKHYSKSFQ